MLKQVQATIPAEIRDFPEWHHGRESYAVWVLALEDEIIQERFKSAREHLNGYLLEPYRRQPHITLFVCGFLVDSPRYNDDFTRAQLKNQIEVVEQAYIQSFEIEIGGLNSFASAPFLEVLDLQGGIARLRELLSRGAREFRTAPYTPHLTVGLYAGAFPSDQMAKRLSKFSYDPVKLNIKQISLATYRAGEIAGLLVHQYELSLVKKKG